jgi:hypothetical protein
MAEITIATNLAAHISVGTPAIVIASITLTITVAVRARIRIRVRSTASGGATSRRLRRVLVPEVPNRGAWTELTQAA